MFLFLNNERRINIAIITNIKARTAETKRNIKNAMITTVAAIRSLLANGIAGLNFKNM